jgi:hypothetical protein
MTLPCPWRATGQTVCSCTGAVRVNVLICRGQGRLQGNQDEMTCRPQRCIGFSRCRWLPAGRAESYSADYEGLKRLLRAGRSLGGARPKAHVIDASGRIAIVKFPSASSDTWNVMAWEEVALDLARDAEITVPDCQLIRVGITACLPLTATTAGAPPASVCRRDGNLAI